MSPPPKKRLPLTREQQATVTQWRPLAIKYVGTALRINGLAHFMDEVEGVAHDALMLAVAAWEPDRGPFPSCLKWWVLSRVKKFSAHDARTVHQSEHSARFVDATSMSALINRKYADSEFGLPDLTLDKAIEGGEIDDPSENMDRRRLLRAAEIVLPRRVLANRDGETARRNAKLSVELWAMRVLDGAPFEELGAPHGLSRQAVQQRVARVQAVFEDWAKPIREEAA